MALKRARRQRKKVTVALNNATGVLDGTPGLERSTMRLVTRRLGLLLFVVYILNYLDRTNIGIAKDHLQASLGLSEAAYGLGAGLFFIGYVLFEVPSNLILYRVGARLWITRIMVTWGLAAMGMAFVQNEMAFYILRFLLGAAEAGLVPGVILYLTQWIPSARRARLIALFYLAVPLSSAFGSPLSGWLMGFNPFGVEGWRFMFFLEGIPCLFVAVLVLAFLTDNPARAKWLDERQRTWLTAALAKEKSEEDTTHQSGTLRQAFINPRVLGMALVFFSMIIPIYALAFFLPAIIKQMGTFSILQVGFITAVPYIFASIGMFLISRRSDRTGERVLHYVVPSALGAGGLVMAALTLGSAPAVAMVGFCIGAIGCLSTLPVFWSITPRLLTGVAAAGGIALVCAIGNIAGFVAPYMVGLIRGENATAASSSQAILVSAGFLLVAAVGMLLVGKSLGKEHAHKSESSANAY
ncbi:ACS family tartrate transporter-like MFS transporter [Arthrobacter sp. OAP107]